MGSLVGQEEIVDLETSKMDEALQAALDEITMNPIIDERIRKNPVIVRELSAVVAGVLQGSPK